MRIRHLVAAANIDTAGRIIDPQRVRHGVVVGGRIASLAGEIDPLTHLNHDFADHRLEGCLIADALVVGASIAADADGWLLAYPTYAAFVHRGPVDVGARRVAWQRPIP